MFTVTYLVAQVEAQRYSPPPPRKNSLRLRLYSVGTGESLLPTKLSIRIILICIFQTGATASPTPRMSGRWFTHLHARQNTNGHHVRPSLSRRSIQLDNLKRFRNLSSMDEKMCACTSNLLSVCSCLA